VVFYLLLGIIRADLVGMFKQRVENTTHTEGRLDDNWQHIATYELGKNTTELLIALNLCIVFLDKVKHTGLFLLNGGEGNHASFQSKSFDTLLAYGVRASLLVGLLDVLNSDVGRTKLNQNGKCQ
jgi:hypothetical protein